jgi:hypothetical protein
VRECARPVKVDVSDATALLCLTITDTRGHPSLL